MKNYRLRKIQTSINLLKSQSPGDLWNLDLDEFETEYKKFMKEYYKYYSLDPKDFKNNSKANKIDLSNMLEAINKKTKSNSKNKPVSNTKTNTKSNINNNKLNNNNNGDHFDPTEKK